MSRKIYERVVISIATGEVLEEVSYDYEGPIVEAKGGGGSSGGSSSGAVDYPDYMKTLHGSWLNHSGADTIISSITDVMNAALGNSPFYGVNAFDPTALLNVMTGAADSFDTFVGALNHISDWQTAFDTAQTKIDAVTINSAAINADIAAHSAQLDDDIENEILPRYEAGMRDIGAVNTTAFVMGKANIWARKVRDVNKYGTALRLHMFNQRNEMILAGVSGITSLQQNRSQLEQAVAQMIIESRRIAIVAQKERADKDASLDEADAKWDLEVFQYGANLLASIAGGTASSANETKQPSQVASALGGALSGAAMGATVGSAVPGIGTAVGAVAGAVIGLGASML